MKYNNALEQATLKETFGNILASVVSGITRFVSGRSHEDGPSPLKLSPRA